jgi:small acid-soluble spore protein (thioredoxin-like protein)
LNKKTKPLHPISIIHQKGMLSMAQNNNRPKPDDRSDNYEKLENMVEDTMGNMAEAKERLEWAPEHEHEQIKEKNKRREEAIDNFRQEMEDEEHQ